MRTLHHKQGFTLVETLIAITVLMIAIAGPLVIATKGLTSALYSKDQMIASFLAQESMEVIKNIRDNNLVSTPPAADWLSGLGTVGTFYDAGGISNPQIQECTSMNSGDPGCPIYYDDVTGFTANPIGNQTQFYRHYYLETVFTSGIQPEVRVHVKVDWNEGAIPFQIHLVSTMVATTQ